MIIVTGGAGFIGSNLVAGLEQAVGGDIVVVDRLGTDDKWRNIAKRELAAIVAPVSSFPTGTRTSMSSQSPFRRCPYAATPNSAAGSRSSTSSRTTSRAMVRPRPVPPVSEPRA